MNMVVVAPSDSLSSNFSIVPSVKILLLLKTYSVTRGYNHHFYLADVRWYFLFIFIIWDVTDNLMTLKTIPPIYRSLDEWYCTNADTKEDPRISHSSFWTTRAIQKIQWVVNSVCRWWAKFKIIWECSKNWPNILQINSKSKAFNSSFESIRNI